MRAVRPERDEEKNKRDMCPCDVQIYWSFYGLYKDHLWALYRPVLPDIPISGFHRDH